ncbi:MAG: hypothetical protein ABI051_00410 [Vicinamibacterales bacterium]
METPVERPAGSIPSGDVGPITDRDERGRFERGNRAAQITGARSVQFWEAADSLRRDLAAGILHDRGYSFDDAPVALRLTALGLAEAQIVRDSAFARMVELGGPLTGKDRERGAHRVWSQASDRVLRHTSAIGFERAAPRVKTAIELLRGDE